ncbi:MAG: hypothetical protein MJY69_02605 [Bacteroidales bacterium]|nr:hypothetical protein [Bacteroidales bacterium]
MEEEKKLYPFRFCTLEDECNWGRMRFGLADLGYRDSLVRDGWLAGNSIGEVMDMYMDRVVGENVFEYWGRQFPVCVRTLEVRGRMPLQVCPSDETAAQRYDLLGKEKLWYVARAGRKAGIAIGFRKVTDASEVYSRCADGSIDGILNYIAPHQGQILRIPAGTVHAAEGDLEIVEIAESSPLDFCLCAWGQALTEDEFDPTLGIVDALDFIDYAPFKSVPASGIPQFCVELIRLKDALRVKGGNPESFTLYSCVSGGASVQLEVLGQTASFPLKSGETVLVPAECPDFLVVPNVAETVVLETTVPYRSEKDGYINSDVPAALPEDSDLTSC